MKKIIDVDLLGFDLDGTLYPLNEEIYRRIREYSCLKASEILNRPYQDVLEQFLRELDKTKSGSRSLQAIGIEDGKGLMQKALENTNIESLLRKDEKLIEMFAKLKQSFSLFLITGSGKLVALRKLEALGLDENLFSYKIYGESKLSRRDGSAFRDIAKNHGTDLSRMFFVGDM